jgi:2-polyprenyl-6-methoxyphenol hydroxylase-like FAD-dependent oxidoreductase
VQHCEVVDVEPEADRSVVRIADGGEQVADLVIRADGVRSVVKRAIFGKDDESNLFIMKKRINNVIVEYAFYYFIFLWTRFPVLRK